MTQMSIAPQVHVLHETVQISNNLKEESENVWKTTNKTISWHFSLSCYFFRFLLNLSQNWCACAGKDYVELLLSSESRNQFVAAPMLQIDFNAYNYGTETSLLE